MLAILQQLNNAEMFHKQITINNSLGSLLTS